MTRSYDLEEFLPWYRRPSPTWLQLSLAARGALASIVMELNPKTGELHLRKGLPSLAVLLRCDWSELESVIDELRQADKLAWDEGSGILKDPDYMSRKRATSTERVRAFRARNAGNECNVSSVSGTQSRSDQIRSDQRSIGNEFPVSRAEGPAPKAPQPEPVTKVNRRKPETPCPASGAAAGEVRDWAERWGIPVGHGEFADFLDHHRKKDARWRDWAAAWRTWTRRAPEFSRRPAPGLVAHEQKQKPTAEQTKRFTDGLAAMIREKAEREAKGTGT